MKTIKLTQGQVALVDDCDYEYLMQWKWYAQRVDNGFRAVRTIYMHTVIAECMDIDARYLDHIDQNPSNNQRSNLRGATNSQNGHNRGHNKNSKTGVKGVYFHKKSGKYEAQITVEGKKHWLGLFNTTSEAEKVVVAKREELVGEFACHSYQTAKVKGVVREIELTQGQVALVSGCDYEHLMKWKWRAQWHHSGFRAVRTVFMYQVVAERMGINARCIDHIDQNPLNDRRSNLRAATVSQNGHNRGCNKNSKTGVKGVFFDKASGNYKTQIMVEGKQYYLGIFATLEEAKKAIVAKREESVGEFACH